MEKIRLYLITSAVICKAQYSVGAGRFDLGRKKGAKRWGNGISRIPWEWEFIYLKRVS